VIAPLDSMTRLPTYQSDKTKRIALGGFLVLTALSCIRVQYPEYFALQHIPTGICLAVLMWLDRKWTLDRTAFITALGMLMLHVLGARYLYSYVPYEEWGRAIFGISIQETFGWQRNHFDRLVHLMYGVTLGIVLARWLPLHFINSRGWASLLAIDLVLSTSGLYELIEWWISLAMAPDWADSFNGQQ
jgi:putative membrane protein